MGLFDDNESDPLDDLIADVMHEMQSMKPYSDDYPEMLSYLERLTKLKGKPAREPVSSNTLALVFGNITIALIIVAYEQKHVITSKVFPQLIRPNQF